MGVKLSVFLSIAVVASGAMLYEPVTAALAPPIARALAPTPPQPQQPPPPNCAPTLVSDVYKARFPGGAEAQLFSPAPPGAVVVPNGCPPPPGYVLNGGHNTLSSWGTIYVPAPR
jgi:hypothetical protein